MRLRERIDCMVWLGKYLAEESASLETAMRLTKAHNPWFTLDNQQTAFRAISGQMLEREKLESWISRYPVSDVTTNTVIGLVPAGNIPMVGFHDLLCVFMAGHSAKIKLSEKDKWMLPHLTEVLATHYPDALKQIQYVDTLRDFDAVIATGSNNTARYFETYFSKYPHIIRKNRNSIAVLDGTETRDELVELGKDIFTYFGLGCRNVSKLYVPNGYDFHPLLDALNDYREIIHHDKYKNNFDYNLALYILNAIPYLANDCVMLVESPHLSSRIASLHYEYYENPSALSESLQPIRDDIQCICSWVKIPGFHAIPFGQAQMPSLADYADGVDTMNFLVKLPS